MEKNIKMKDIKELGEQLGELQRGLWSSRKRASDW